MPVIATISVEQRIDKARESTDGNGANYSKRIGMDCQSLTKIERNAPQERGISGLIEMQR